MAHPLEEHAWLQRLITAAREGSPIDMSDVAEAEALQAARSEEWPEERWIPSAAIRAALLHEDLRADPHGLRICGARVVGKLDLEHARLPCALHITNSSFDSEIDLTDSHIVELNLSGSRVGRLGLDGSVTESSILLASILSSARVSATGARISGQLVLANAKIADLNDDEALALDSISVAAGAFLEGLHTTGKVRAVGGRFGGDLVLAGAQIESSSADALLLDHATIEGSAFMNDVSLRGALRAAGAAIGQQLNLSGAEISASSDGSLVMDGIKVGGAVFLDKGLFKGPIIARSLSIGNQLLARGATVLNGGSTAILLDSARVDGITSFAGLKCEGGIRANRADFGKEFTLSDSELSAEGGDALHLDGARVRGGLLITRAKVIGRIRAVHGQVGNELNLVDALVQGNGGAALVLDGLQADGDVHLTGMTATGAIRLIGCRVAGECNCDRTRVLDAQGAAIDFYSSKIERLFLRETQCQGFFDFTRMEIGDLRLDESSPGVSNSPMTARGWSINDIHGAIREDRRLAARWLGNLPTGVPFTTQPWHVLAGVYERNGQEADGRWIRWKAARAATRIAPPLSRPFRLAYGTVVGYGYYPLWAAVWLLTSLLLTTVLTGLNAESFAPTDPLLASRAVTENMEASGRAEAEPIAVNGATDCELLAPAYPCLNPGLYALATVVPAAAAVQVEGWVVTDPGANWLVWCYTALKAFGWLLTALLLAGLTGLLKKG